jgi:hypothetical protein
MSRNKVCVLRDPLEIEALSRLEYFKHAILARYITNAEASIEFQPFAGNLPDCDHHIHKTKREANRLERQGCLHFLPGFEDHYAQEQKRDWSVLPRAWQKRPSGGVHVMQLVEA